MKIKLSKAFDLISGAAAVILDDDYLIYPDMADLNGEEENEFLYLSTANMACKFNEGCNPDVEMEGDTLILYDTDGEKAEIKLLFPTVLASFCQEEDII